MTSNQSQAPANPPQARTPIGELLAMRRQRPLVETPLLLVLTAMPSEQPKRTPEFAYSAGPLALQIQYRAVDYTNQLHVGGANAAAIAARLIIQLRPDAVLFMGTCGSLRADLKKGDVVAASEIVNGDLNLSKFNADLPIQTIALEAGPASLRPARFYSASAFVDESGKTALVGKGDVVEMESFAIARLCQELGVPVWVIKAVSDDFDGNAKDEFMQFLKNEYRPEAILEAFLDFLAPRWPYIQSER